jgi:hypothetical protein
MSSKQSERVVSGDVKKNDIIRGTKSSTLNRGVVRERIEPGWVEMKGEDRKNENTWHWPH